MTDQERSTDRIMNAIADLEATVKDMNVRLQRLIDSQDAAEPNQAVLGTLMENIDGETFDRIFGDIAATVIPPGSDLGRELSERHQANRARISG